MLFWYKWSRYWNFPFSKYCNFIISTHIFGHCEEISLYLSARKFLFLITTEKILRMLKLSVVVVLLLGLLIPCQAFSTNTCEGLFEGFGIHLGSIDHFVPSRPKTIPQVVHRIYNDLGIR